MRVLVFGASSAQGYWDSEGGWADRLKHYYDDLQMKDFSVDYPAVMNLGISGDTAEEVLKRIGPESKARQNDKGLAIIIQVGTNNAAEQNGQLRSTTEDYKTELQAILKKAEEFTYKIIVVGFPAVNEAKTNPIEWADLAYKNQNIAKFENAAKDICEKFDIPFIPIQQEFLRRTGTGADLQAHDGLHPNNEGHKLIFELVRPELDKLLNT